MEKTEPSAGGNVKWFSQGVKKQMHTYSLKNSAPVYLKVLEAGTQMAIRCKQPKCPPTDE